MENKRRAASPGCWCEDGQAVRSHKQFGVYYCARSVAPARPPAMRALVLSRSLRNTIRSFVRQDAEYSVTALDGPSVRHWDDMVVCGVISWIERIGTLLWSQWREQTKYYVPLRTALQWKQEDDILWVMLCGWGVKAVCGWQLKLALNQHSNVFWSPS